MALGAYVAQRLLLTAVTLVGMVLATFVLMSVLPGNPLDLLFTYRRDPAAVERMRRELGLDAPLTRRLGRFLWKAAQGDLGHSLRTREPVAGAIAARFRVSLRLGLAAMAVGSLMGLTMGALAAGWHGSWVDRMATLLSLVGLSAPVFWSGLLLQFYFGYELGWFPISGWGSWRHLVLPAVTLGTRYAASIARYTRSFLLEVLGEDFIRTARAKGLSGTRVLLRHALRNALGPIVTVLGLDLAGLLTGAVLTESVFGIPGVGRLAYEAIYFRDYFLVQGIVLFLGAVFVVANLLVDLSYAWLNPRIRYGSGV